MLAAYVLSPTWLLDLGAVGNKSQQIGKPIAECRRSAAYKKQGRGGNQNLAKSGLIRTQVFFFVMMEHGLAFISPIGGYGFKKRIVWDEHQVLLRPPPCKKKNKLTNEAKECSP